MSPRLPRSRNDWTEPDSNPDTATTCEVAKVTAGLASAKANELGNTEVLNASRRFEIGIPQCVVSKVIQKLGMQIFGMIFSVDKQVESESEPEQRSCK